MEVRKALLRSGLICSGIVVYFDIISQDRDRFVVLRRKQAGTERWQDASPGSTVSRPEVRSRHGSSDRNLANKEAR